ncbi:g11912 [Coccomyxa elongata]
MALFEQVHAIGNGSNGLSKAKFCTYYAGLVVVVEMEMYGPDLEQSAPEDEQAFKAACCGLLGALALLHDNNLVHCGIKAANLVWFDKVRRDSVVLVDLDSVCQVDTIMPKKCRLSRWDDATLDKHGCYGKASDVHEAGKLLKMLINSGQSQLHSSVIS